MESLLFGVVGVLLFLAISLLPGILLGWWYYTGGRTHLIVVPVIAVLFGALWAISTFIGGRSALGGRSATGHS